MKTTTILCTAIAATMGLGGLAQAQDTRQERREARQEARQETRQERRQERRQEARQERRQEARQDARQDRRRDRLEARRVPNFVNTPLANVRDPEPHQQRYYNNYAPQRHSNYAPQRYYNHRAPQYYGNAGPRFYRGGYLPYSYRQPTYHVNWRAYPSRLYAPPYGYQWVHVGDEFLLIALASGLIATKLAM